LIGIKHKLTTRVVLGACARLSGWVPDGILSCSAAARQVPVNCGGKNAGGAQDLLTFARCAGSSVNTAESGMEHDTPLVELAI
jgi:hypothetical protein